MSHQHQQQQFHHYHQHIHQVQSESQLERRSSSDLEPNRNRNTDRIGSSMDFRNLCQRIDVESLRAKLPQLKLPKSLPKLRGRKIFRSSRSGADAAGEGGAGAGTAAGRSSKDAGGGGGAHHHLQVAPQSQQFINRTPQRISTISSLMYEGEQEEQLRSGNQNQNQQQPGTYRSAGSLDDDYYAPGSGERASRPISPIKIPADDNRSSPKATTLTQRLQRGYKSLSELRIKHIFAKQTTVRRDQIEVDRYVEQYERELKTEKLARERRDREIAENYDIKIKTLAGSRQNTFDDDVEVEHRQFEQKTKVDRSHETDESGMEATPPSLPSRRKPGIAATRFAKVRKPPLEMEEHSADLEEPAVNREAPLQRPSSYKQLLNKLPHHLPSLPNLSQFSRSKGDPTKSAENEGAGTGALENATSSNSKFGIRQNIKRLRKSIKRPAKIKGKPSANPPDSDEEENEEGEVPAKEPPGKIRESSGNLRARLSRFASTEQLQQRWRKSFKERSPNRDETKEDESKPGATGGVLGGLLLGSQLEKTLAKLNERMHQLKFFQRHSNENASTSKAKVEQPKPNTVGHEPVEIDDDEELAATYHRSDSLEDENNDDSGEDISAEEAFGQIQPEEEEDLDQEQSSSLSGNATTHAARQMAKLAEIQAASKSGAGAAWSSESLEEIADEDYPRVLIHQEHSDAYESTLIIAMASSKGRLKTSPYPEIKISKSGPQRLSYSPPPPQNPNPNPPEKSKSPSPEFKSPKCDSNNVWLPNERIIAGFKEQTWPAPALYKPKSIDIFEASAGGSSSAFADFDEALRNAPVLRISAGSSIDTSGEEADDSSSRVTRIRVQSPQIGNSRESLMAQEEEEEEDRYSEEDEEDEEEEEEERDASERPPSESPPPPPLPQRRPPPKRPATPPIYDAVPPPLPISKPPAVAAPAPPAPSPTPIARALPQRSASMSRPSKPLVKTSSLRLTYREQVRPGDVGKVNKLISRFEGGRPRLCPRRMHSEGEEEEVDLPEMEQILELQISEKRAVDSVTPTNRGGAVVIPQITLNNNNNNQDQDHDDEIVRSGKKKTMELALDRQNSNCSRSEYGSPLSFPSSRRSSTPTNISIPNPSSNPNPNPNANQILQHQRRSRRSMTRDDDNFYSFDSDEENSYYSISPSGSSRYVVEI